MKVKNNVTKGPKVTDYEHSDQRTHVYDVPDMYIGSDVKLTRDEWLFDLETEIISLKTIDYVPGCERIFLEILSNASDNCNKSKRLGVECGKIEITMNDREITIKNYGLPIPLDIHPKEKVPLPQMIFGTLLTSSNYVKERHEIGNP